MPTWQRHATPQPHLHSYVCLALDHLCIGVETIRLADKAMLGCPIIGLFHAIEGDTLALPVNR